MWGLHIHYVMQFANSTAIQLAVRVKGSSTSIRGAEWLGDHQWRVMTTGAGALGKVALP